MSDFLLGVIIEHGEYLMFQPVQDEILARLKKNPSLRAMVNYDQAEDGVKSEQLPVRRCYNHAGVTADTLAAIEERAPVLTFER